MSSKPQPLPASEELDFSAAELAELWSLLDGAIMNADIRQHLHKSWGLCSRHSWGFAVAEIELRGGAPFATTILYEDLIGRAARSLKGQSRAHARLESKAKCFTCDYVEIAHGEGVPGSAAQADIANRRTRLVPLLKASKAQWLGASCPECLGGSGPTCRLHLLAGADSPTQLADKLADLHQRLRRFKESMTWQGPKAGASDRSSWVEAIGWSAGWRYPVAALGDQHQERRAG